MNDDQLATRAPGKPAAQPSVPNAAPAVDPPTRTEPRSSPFHSLDDFVAVPRVGGLALSPDGTRLVVSVAELSSDRTRYISALWELDPHGTRPARRLTRSAQGESAPAFRSDGTLLFLSARPVPDPGKDEPEKEEPALWELPADGGEARRLHARPGGIGSFVPALSADRLAVTSGLLPGSGDARTDAELRKARKEAEVSAVLHESPHVRFWDQDLGPDFPHVFTVAAEDLRAAGESPEESAAVVDCGPIGPLEPTLALSPDGTLVAYSVIVPQEGGESRSVIVVADAVTGNEVRRLAAPDAEFTAPGFTPDSRSLVCLRSGVGDWDNSNASTLWLVPEATDPQDQGRDLLPDFDNWPVAATVSRVPGDPVVYFVADERGHAPVFRLDTSEGTVTRLTAAGTYSDVTVSLDGSTLYALRSSVDAPPAPVRLDAREADQTPGALPAPGGVGELPGRLAEVHTVAEDGQALRAWLVLPEGASAERPAPFLLWVHGGPQTSWNAWTWRWNPWVAAAAGYAVLLPDPALSTGYGQHMHQRGWGDWGGTPYRDLMALTDAALEREDLDATRTAAMGGSFGGYMANWIATRTDRFKAIVTHASLWNLNAFGSTTDAPSYWRRHFGDPLTRPERYHDASPHRHAASIRTPMLVVHGDKDYRVPIGEGLALWNDLVRFEVPAKFLYFPDEGHWVLKPNNAKVWYRTVLAFLAHHVRGEEWQRPELV